MTPSHPLPLLVAFLIFFSAATALAQRPTLITVANGDTGSAAGNSEDAVVPAFTTQVVAFHSFSSNLVPNDVNGRRDVFVRDLAQGKTVLVSANFAGTGTGNGTSQNPTISGNGRYVVFESDASNLVANDTNNNIDIFLRDLDTRTTTLLSVNSSGTGSANSSSVNAVISANARYVAFSSFASNIVTFDNNNTVDIFVRDLDFNQTRMISCDLACTAPGNDASFMPDLPKDKSGRAVFSRDGRFLVFESRATNLTGTNDVNGHIPDVFVRDMDIGLTKVVSANPQLTATANAGSQHPVISDNGQFVFFQSTATDLTPNDTHNGLDLFVCDLNTNQKSLVSVTTTNTGSNTHSDSQYFPVASEDGRYIIFQSDARTYVTNDTNNNTDVFRRDLQTNTTTLISVTTSGGTTATSTALRSLMSSDGRLVVFIGFGGEFSATPDLNFRNDVFVRDVEAGTTTLMSTNTAGTAACNNGASFASLSLFGGFVYFESGATDITPNTAPNSNNIFVNLVGPEAKLDLATLTVNESAGNASISVTRIGDVSGTLTVLYTTVDGTAKAPSDYTTALNILNFAAGETSKTILIPIVDDALDETDETFVVVLSNFLSATITPPTLSTTVVTIADNDAPPSITIDDISVSEGDSGTKVAEFTLTLSAESGKVASVNIAPVSITALSGTDFTMPFSLVFMSPGQTSQKLAVQIHGDRIFEDDETFAINLSNPTNVTIADAQGTGTITNDDPIPSISMNDLTIAEGKSGARIVFLTAKLSNPSSRTVTVQFATADGTAQAGSDYQHSTGTLSISPGITTAFLPVIINGDPIVETDETFFGNISNPGEATIADSQGVVTIQNDDLPPVLLTEDGTLRAAAIDTTLALRDPFPLFRSIFGQDVTTRVSFFAFNLDLVSGENFTAVSASGEDEFGNVHPLLVEFVGVVPGVDGLSQVVVRLPAILDNAHELKIKLTLRGQSSNVAPIRISGP